MHRTAPSLARALVATLSLAACASTSAGTTGTPRDAADVVDAAQPDVAAPDVAPPDVGPDIAPDVGPDDVAADDVDDAAAPGPIDGAWRVTDIVCGGAPGSAAARAYITAPNSSSFVVRGERSVYTLRTSTCTQRLTSTVAYPSPGRAVFTATGPFACEPARCGAGCGTTPSIPYVYDYARRGAGLVMTTVGPTPDLTCTAYGQSNPITYTYEAI